MALYTLVRFEVRPDARETVDRAVHEYASYVRAELEGTMWTVYRDPDVPTRYVALVRDTTPAATERARKADGTRAFEAALQDALAGPIERMPCELVTSSDLAPRPHRNSRRSAR